MGEISVSTSAPASATVTLTEPGLLWRIEAERLADSADTDFLSVGGNRSLPAADVVECRHRRALCAQHRARRKVRPLPEIEKDALLPGWQARKMLVHESAFVRTETGTAVLPAAEGELQDVHRYQSGFPEHADRVGQDKNRIANAGDR